MKRTELIMGMPITVMIPDRSGWTGRPGARFRTLEEAADGVFAHSARSMPSSAHTCRTAKPAG